MPVDFIGLFGVLATANVRFVVVGGLAVLLHGVDRLTADVDLVIDLAPEATARTITALTESGYRPLAPVPALEFADPAKRAAWQRDRGMQVFSFWDTRNVRPTVDVLLESPIAFDALWRDAVEMRIGSIAVRVASLEHLIQMKEAVGRPQDLADVARLRVRLAAR
jgi:hypothetical protein